mmetsp:Transcript_9329/g.14717  ORF Transcript_9329/g.14717 Transcript_9329/m.14717 type:complete len:224 (-) Transcript_9329:1-672(-)
MHLVLQTGWLPWRPEKPSLGESPPELVVYAVRREQVEQQAVALIQVAQPTHQPTTGLLGPVLPAEQGAGAKPTDQTAKHLSNVGNHPLHRRPREHLEHSPSHGRPWLAGSVGPNPLTGSHGLQRCPCCAAQCPFFLLGPPENGSACFLMFPLRLLPSFLKGECARRSGLVSARQCQSLRPQLGRAQPHVQAGRPHHWEMGQGLSIGAWPDPIRADRPACQDGC